MIGLITVQQMQLARLGYKTLQQEIHSVPFNRRGVTTAREASHIKTEFGAGVIQIANTPPTPTLQSD